jgi:hypothetical protein
MQPQKSNKTTRTIIQIGLIGLLVIAGLNYDRLLDQYALSTYTPTRQVSDFETRVPLSDKARATLYRANPKFDAKASFNTDCNTQPHELELGCFYHGRIFILTIDNPWMTSKPAETALCRAVSGREFVLFCFEYFFCAGTYR